MTAMSPAKVAVTHPAALAPFCSVLTHDGPAPFEAFPHQVELWNAAVKHPKVLLIKARQLGVSWAVALLALWWIMAHPGCSVAMVSIGEREAKSLLKKVKFLYDSLPASIRRAYPVCVNTQLEFAVTHPDGDSTIFSLPSSSTAGRGETFALIVGDERPHWPFADEQEASLLPAAADHGHVVMVGTANGMDSIYTRWMEAPGNGWHPIFVGALARPGRTKEWALAERAALGDIGPQELPFEAAEAFLSSGRCAFDRQALIDLQEHSCEDPKWRGIVESAKAPDRSGYTWLVPHDLDDGDWQVWEWPERGRSYIVAADVAAGRADGDYSTAVIYDATSWDQVAAYHAHSEPAVFARELNKMGLIYNKALLAPEANNHGQAVVALLIGWGYPYLYQHRAVDKRRRRAETRYGWQTTEQSRVTLVHALEKAVTEGSLGIRDGAAVGEMHRFVWKETLRGGRFEAETGAHDDRVIAHGIAAVLLQMGHYAVRGDHRPIEQPPMPSDKTGYEPQVVYSGFS